MASAERVKDLASVISAAGQTIQQMPTSPMKAAGRALELGGNYIEGLSDAVINSAGTNKSDAEVIGHFLAQWLVANAAADLALFLSSRLITAAVVSAAASFGAPVAVAVGLGLIGATIYSSASGGQYVGGKL